MMKPAVLNGRILEVPIIQGGMGVGISLSSLAGHVMKEGGMGVISAAHPGYARSDFRIDSMHANCEAIKEECAKARAISGGRGLLGVNIMVASTDYDTYVKASVEAGADAIISGAGLPLHLPSLVEGSDILLAPVISSAKAAKLVLRYWDSHYGRTPDFIVIEGSEAGGHLGFSKEEAQQAQTGHPRPLLELLQEVLTALEPFRQKYGRDIPVFVAGGIKNGAEMRRYTDAGAAGAQFATRFIATQECDADEGYKQALLHAKPEDITIVQSPVGMPGRALHSPLIQRVEAGTQPPVDRCIRCLSACDPKTAPYCISKALMAAARGDWENGLFFCGAGAGEINTLSTVQEQMDQIMNEWRTAP